MNPIQKWLLFCAAALGYAVMLGVPREVLAAPTFCLMWFCILAAVEDCVWLVREGKS